MLPLVGLDTIHMWMGANGANACEFRAIGHMQLGANGCKWKN